jgi:hypothetical protein
VGDTFAATSTSSATHVAKPAKNVRPIFNFMAILLNLASGSKRACSYTTTTVEPQTSAPKCARPLRIPLVRATRQEDERDYPTTSGLLVEALVVG